MGFNNISLITIVNRSFFNITLTVNDVTNATGKGLGSSMELEKVTSYSNFKVVSSSWAYSY